MRTWGVLCALGAFANYAAAQEMNARGLNVSVDVGPVSVDIDADLDLLAGCSQTCTVRETTITTVRETHFVTVTESAGTVTTTTTAYTTDHELTTEYVVTTTTKTFETSYPVTVTTVTNCEEPSAYPTDYSADCWECHPTPICETVTTTEWSTTTTTELSTVIEPTTTTKTVPTVVPTTVPTPVPTTDYVTRTSPTTIWKPTTYTTTATVTTEYPVTVTDGTTIVTTSVTTAYETTVTTLTTSVPVISYTTDLTTRTVTEPGETITGPGETVTAPGETVTLPGDVTTLPGSTVTTTVISDGATTTTTVVVPPTTVTETASTVTVTPIFDVTLCPTPTGNYAALATDSDLTWGCKPGKVCNPPKPEGCNFWPGPPDPEFLCDPSDCITPPPFKNVTWDWEHGETDYYPPSYGYFDLNPEAFGLSYDIFEYEVVEKVKHHKTYTITTGNWESQATLSEWPRTTSTAAPDQYKERLRREVSKRGKTVPGTCFAICSSPLKIGLETGKTDDLCDLNGRFMGAVDTCKQCIKKWTPTTKDDPLRGYLNSQLLQYLDFCDGRNPDPTSSSPTGPESEVTSTPDVTSTSQIEPSTGSFTPIEPSLTSSSETSTPSVPPPTSTDEPTSTPPTTTAEQSTPEQSTPAPSESGSTEPMPTPSESTPGQESSSPESLPTASPTMPSAGVPSEEPSSQPGAPGVPPGSPPYSVSGSHTVPGTTGTGVWPPGTTTPPVVPTTGAGARLTANLPLGATLFAMLAAIFT